MPRDSPWHLKLRDPEHLRLYEAGVFRRVTFIGLTQTPDEKMRNQMRDFNEGDIFSRAKLIKTLRKMNRFRSEIYPLRLTDLMLQLNEADETVDMTICFRPKRR